MFCYLLWFSLRDAKAASWLVLPVLHGASRFFNHHSSRTRLPSIGHLPSVVKLLHLDHPSVSLCFPFNLMAPSAITDFPLELQLTILEYLSPSDLLHAIRASKDLRSAVENVLYGGITLEWNHKRQPSFSGLLRTLFARPELAHHIKRLHLKGSTLDKGRYVTWRPELPSLSVAGFPLKQARSLSILLR